MKRLLLVVTIVMVAISVTLLLKDRIALYLFKQNIEKLISRSLADELGIGVHVAFCGTGSPLPDPARGGACTAVIAGEHIFLFDAGEGAAESLALMGILPSDVDSVFLTHFHSDHINGLGALALQHVFRGGVVEPLPIYGGPGVERIVNGFNEAFALDHEYRVAHHGAEVAPPTGFELLAMPLSAPKSGSRQIFAADGVVIDVFEVDHHPISPAYGYRVTYRGLTVVISGDTGYSANLIRAAANADLLVHEALSPGLVSIIGDTASRYQRHGLASVMRDIPDYHASPNDAIRVASEASVGALALTHLIPGLPGSWFDSLFLGDVAKTFRGDLLIMRDGDVISLQGNGPEVQNAY